MRKRLERQSRFARGNTRRINSIASGKSQRGRKSSYRGRNQNSLGRALALTLTGAAATLGLAGCGNDVVEGTYTFVPTDGRYKSEAVEVEAWEEDWGRRMTLYVPGRAAEHIQATDSTENGDTQLWEEIESVTLTGDSPLLYLHDPEKLEEVWKSVYVEQKGNSE